MAIISSVIVINRPDSLTTLKIRILHTDHLAKEWVDNIYGVDNTIDQIGLDALVAESAVKMNARLSDMEINGWISQLSSGLDPWHTSPFVNSVPEYNTWLDAASGSLKFYLSFEDRQELLNVAQAVSNTSNADMDSLLIACGSTFTRTDLNTHIANATNTKVELDAYTVSVEV